MLLFNSKAILSQKKNVQCLACGFCCERTECYAVGTGVVGAKRKLLSSTKSNEVFSVPA